MPQGRRQMRNPDRTGPQAHCAQSLGSTPVLASEIGVSGTSVFQVPLGLLPISPSLQIIPLTGQMMEPCSPVCPNCQLDWALSWMMLGGHVLRLFGSPPTTSTTSLFILEPNDPFLHIFLGTIPGKSMNNSHPLVMQDLLPNSCSTITSSRTVLEADQCSLQK